MTPMSPPQASTPPRRRRKPGRCVRLHGIDWATYEKLLELFAERPGVKLTYDRGELEIMAPSMEHEDDGDLLGDFAKILTQIHGLPIRSGGSVTLKRKKQLRGIEADRCFWIANAPMMAGVRQLDLRIHPPPDLAIEVDVSHSSLNRFGIYARIGVPELWRLEGDDLRFHALGANRKYTEIAESHTFPHIAPAVLMRFLLAARTAADQNTTREAFRAWVKEHIANQSPPQTPPEGQP